MRRLDQEFPGAAPLHLVLDNYGTHKHPKVRTWLKRHPRFIPHFVPTSASWLNLIERWFGELTGKRGRRGSFANVEELQQAIMEFLAAWNEDPKPFVWTATVQMIQEKLTRCRQTLEQIQPGCTQPRRRRPTKALSSQFLDTTLVLLCQIRRSISVANRFDQLFVLVPDMHVGYAASQCSIARRPHGSAGC